MKTGESIFAIFAKNLIFDVGISGIMHGVGQGLIAFFSNNKEEVASLLDSTVEEEQ